MIKLRSVKILKGFAFHLFYFHKNFLPCVSRALVSALGEQPVISTIVFFICILSSHRSLLRLEIGREF